MYWASLCTKGNLRWDKVLCCQGASRLAWEDKSDPKKEELKNNPSWHVPSVKNECEAHSYFFLSRRNVISTILRVTHSFCLQKSRWSKGVGNAGVYILVVHYLRRSLSHVNFRQADSKTPVVWITRAWFMQLGYSTVCAAEILTTDIQVRRDVRQGDHFTAGWEGHRTNQQVLLPVKSLYFHPGPKSMECIFF